jgi:hypothetical protein
MNINNVTTEIDGIRGENVFYAYFTNNGNKSLCVNGTTPKEFTLEELDCDMFLVNRVDYLISQDEAIDLSKFGSLTSLTNGILFSVGNSTFKTNGDIMMFATDSSVSSVKISGTTSSIISGHWDVSQSFGNGLLINKDDLKITVRDNLSTLQYLQFAVSGIKL